MEDEFYHLTMKGNDLKTYVRRFQDLATLCPTMVPDYEKMMEFFIGGLPPSIEGNVTASKPQTLEEAINIAQRLMDQVTKHTSVQVSSDHKRKFDDSITATIITNHNRTEDRKPLGLMLSLQLKIMGGPSNQELHKQRAATGSNLLLVTVTCHACGEKGHYANQCRKITSNNAQGRAYMLRDRNAYQDQNVLTNSFFPEDLPGLPPVRQVEFQINLKFMTTTPVARAPYRLSPSEMQELSNQLQELSGRDYLNPKELKHSELDLISYAISSKLTSQVLNYPSTKALKEENIKAKNLRGMDKSFEIRPDGTRCIKNQSWLPLFDFGKGWEKYLPLVEFPYNNSYHASIKAAPFEALYGRKCRSPVCWAEVGDIGPVAYKLALPKELSNVHSTFNVSNLKKCLSDESLVIPTKELRLNDKLNFVEEPVEIMDREVKQLKQSHIPIVKLANLSSISKGSEGAVELICWFDHTESVFSCSNCTEDYKVKFATGTLTEEALSWWNSFAQPIRIEEAYKITRV
ncbi:reverse transcriptase domain-containing protein [Tanacetum coccineum]